MCELKKQLSRDSYGSKPWESLGSPTMRSPTSGLPLLDRLYKDTMFPVQNMPILQNLVWKRPQEICKFPQFIADGATRMDICQGKLNDCWFLSAVASLSLNNTLLDQVVPPGQDFQRGYNGCFRFRFWQYGEWTEVQIDDRLPTENGELVYMRSSNREEFWSALLEKAYAKLKGGYTALDMGLPHEALADMTGGITEGLPVPSDPQILDSLLHPLLQKGALVNCANTEGTFGKKNKFEIVYYHAYTMTGFETIATTKGPVHLVRIRNPWGNTEWNGPWSDNGKEWNDVSAEEQRRVERVQQKDGEFWMTPEDFCRNFSVIEICHLSEVTLSESRVIKPWKFTLYHGRWIPRQGPPQYSLNLLEEDKISISGDPEKQCSFLLALMQKHTRKTGGPYNTALLIYKAPSDRDFLSSRDLAQLTPERRMAVMQRRELVYRDRLPPGRYIIVPHTENRRGGEFILRVLTEKGNQTIAVETPAVEDEHSITPPMSPRLAGLLSINEVGDLFVKHCGKEPYCTPSDLYNMLTEAIAKGIFAGSEKQLSLEHCKSFVVLMDSQGKGQLDLMEFQALWEQLWEWTGIFMTFDKNKNQVLDYHEIPPALTAAGISVDDFIMQLIVLRYTETGGKVSFPGFLFLLTKLNFMIREFQACDATGKGVISVNFRKFLKMTMYN
ncbi:calpain-1 catalytic subunit-like [Carassius carassius]|uniref:calpain-1 catalytic subunit-like n=1 Tax=Carassius carassius TaxID=217509 RepID=UPI002868C7B3|nr:calpain-1 catalytic subunit-like [Carassius carassius]